MRQSSIKQHLKYINFVLQLYADEQSREAFRSGFIAGGEGWRFLQKAEVEWEDEYNEWKSNQEENGNK